MLAFKSLKVRRLIKKIYCFVLILSNFRVTILVTFWYIDVTFRHDYRGRPE